MDFSMIIEYFEFVIVLACLVIGYIIKHSSVFKWVKNDNIPLILAVVGAVLNPFVSGLSIESVVFGAAMGLCSTGLHQGFTTFVDNIGNFFNLNNSK